MGNLSIMSYVINLKSSPIHLQYNYIYDNDFDIVNDTIDADKINL